MRNLRHFFFFSLVTLSLAAPVKAADFEGEVLGGEYKRHALLTEHFQIEFSPLTLDQADSDGDGISDVIEVVAEAAEDSWDVFVDDLNYLNPTNAEMPRILLILDDRNQYVSGGAIGVTGFFVDGRIYMAVDAFFNIDDLGVTVAHEFYHVLQFTYDDDFTYSQKYGSNAVGRNWGEASAMWAQTMVYPDVNEYVFYLEDFLSYTDYSVFAQYIPSDTLFQYGLGIWPRFLYEYTGDADLIRDIWETYVETNPSTPEPTDMYLAISEALNSRGWNLNDLFVEFTVWNAEADRFYDDGALFPDFYWIEDVVLGEYASVDDLYAPALYGSNYLYFENIEGEEQFVFHLVKPEVVEFSLTLLPYRNGRLLLTEKEQLYLAYNETLDDFIQFEQAADWDGVLVIVSPLAHSDLQNLETPFDEGVLYYYLAEYGDVVEQGVEPDLGDSSVEDKEGDLPDAEDDRGYTGVRFEVIDYDESSAQFRWTRPNLSDLAGYEIRYGTASGDYEEVFLVDQPFQVVSTVSGLETDQDYFFQLQAVDAEGDDLGEPSNEVAVRPADLLFTDLSYLDPSYEAIAGLVDLEVFQGYPDGSFQPRRSINRAELLKILIEARGFDPDPLVYRNCFVDVREDWYAPYVCLAKEQGWVQGYSDGFFRPANTVNKVEALKILFEVYEVGLREGAAVRMLPYPDLELDAWYSIYVWEAVNEGLLSENSGNSFFGEAGRNRADMAEILFRYL